MTKWLRDENRNKTKNKNDIVGWFYFREDFSLNGIKNFYMFEHSLSDKVINVYHLNTKQDSWRRLFTFLVSDLSTQDFISKLSYQTNDLKNMNILK